MFPYGAIVVRNDNNIQAVQPDIFIQTYTHADGKAIKLVDLKQINAKEIGQIEHKPFSKEVQNEQPERITKRRNAIDLERLNLHIP